MYSTRRDNAKHYGSCCAYDIRKKQWKKLLYVISNILNAGPAGLDLTSLLLLVFYSSVVATPVPLGTGLFPPEMVTRCFSILPPSDYTLWEESSLATHLRTCEFLSLTFHSRKHGLVLTFVPLVGLLTLKRARLARWHFQKPPLNLVLYKCFGLPPTRMQERYMRKYPRFSQLEDRL